MYNMENNLSMYQYQKPATATRQFFRRFGTRHYVVASKE